MGSFTRCDEPIILQVQCMGAVYLSLLCDQDRGQIWGLVPDTKYLQQRCLPSVLLQLCVLDIQVFLEYSDLFLHKIKITTYAYNTFVHSMLPCMHAWVVLLISASNTHIH